MRTSTLDDISAAIGYTATQVLRAWYSGKYLMVPAQPRDDHPLATLIGASAFRALVVNFGATCLRIPGDHAERWYCRDRVIAERLAEGATLAQIADGLDLDLRRVQQIAALVRARGWITYAEGHAPRRGRRAADAASVPPTLIPAYESAVEPPPGPPGDGEI